jgi:hypothetical protein
LVRVRKAGKEDNRKKDIQDSDSSLRRAGKPYASSQAIFGNSNKLIDVCERRRDEVQDIDHDKSILETRRRETSKGHAGQAFSISKGRESHQEPSRQFTDALFSWMYRESLQHVQSV